MEARAIAEQEEQPKDKIFTKSSIIIVAVFLVLQLGAMTVFLVPKMFAGGKAEKDQAAISELDKIALIPLGRFEISKPNDPMRQSYTHVSVQIDLQVPTERAQEIEGKVNKLSAIFRECARQAFLDADTRDLAGENVTGVKNAIKTRVNQRLGEDVVRDVVFGDYRAY
jgi:flagellar basal body-associated protein FliL